MEESLNFENGNESNRLIRKLTKLNKKIQHKPSTLEKLICLASEFNDNKIYTDYCRGQIEMFERIRQFEKDFPCGLEYPLPPDPPPDKRHSVNPLSAPVPEKIIKSFPEFLVHAKRDELADQLKSVFRSEKGVPIRLMIEVLRSYDPPLIALGTYEKAELCNSLKIFFNRNTGSRQGIFPSGFDLSYYEDDLISTKAKIDFILKSIQ